jgi:DNA-binding NarL/FixJ family response regulator
MKPKKTIAVVDDHSVFREGLVSLLKEYEDFEVVLQASNGKELLDSLKKVKPQIILLDIEMPIMDGIETTIQLKKKYPNIKIIILTMHNEQGLVFELMGKGANGFVPKDKSVEFVVDAIYAVLEKGFYYNDAVAKAVIDGVRNNQTIKKSFQQTSLSGREIEIIKLICKQHTSREIGEILNLSNRTVEAHKYNILSKTKSTNTAGVVLYAIEHHLLD